MSPRMVVSSANFRMMLELCVATQSCVYREYRRGLSTQPWGPPVLRVSEEEVWLPILTSWGLLVRKSRIQYGDDRDLNCIVFKENLTYSMFKYTCVCVCVCLYL